jgi:outer membrane protein TolC
MSTASFPKLAIALLAASATAGAADPLSLGDAVKTALAKHPSLTAANARTAAAAERITQARSGFQPKLNYQESVQGGNNPVFVFGSLLTQHRFTEKNFGLDKLNRPDVLSNFQSLVTLDQNLYDGGQTKAHIRTAEAGRKAAAEGERETRMRVIANVVGAYYGTTLASESVKTAEESMRSAEADLKRAEAVRDAGMATDADVLAIRVHLAATREQKIRRDADLTVARAALNEALGLPLDTEHELTTPLAAMKEQPDSLVELESEALRLRPDARQAEHGVEAAQSQLAAAKAARMPQISARAAFEADRQRFITRAGANFFIGGSLRWNLFDGNAAKSRVAEAASHSRLAEAQRDQLQQGVKLQVRKAHADRAAAEQRLDVADATVAQAEESLRIIKNRFEAGLTTVTELLRAETALLDVRTRRLAAIHDQRLAAAALELSAGILSEDSEVLR